MLIIGPEEPARDMDRPGARSRAEEESTMLYTVAVVLIVLWLVGLLSSNSMGGFIHALLVIAVILVLLRVISGRKAL